jgi:hypothetical protein
MRALNRHVERVFDPPHKNHHWGRRKLRRDQRPCSSTSTQQKEVGDVDYIKVFANREAAERWFEENDPEGVAFEYEVLE